MCELLANPQAYDGLMIEVSGMISTGGGLWLSDGKCRSHITVGDYVFADIVALTDPQDRQFRLHPATFEWNKQDQDNLREALGQLRSALRPDDRLNVHGRVVEIQGTVVGLFETRRPIQRLVSRLGSPSGFGDQGIAPAQLLVKRTFHLGKGRTK